MQLGLLVVGSIDRFLPVRMWVYSSYWNYYYETDFDTAS